MRNKFTLALLATGLVGANLAHAQGGNYDRDNSRSNSRYERDLIDAYKIGYKDGVNDYKAGYQAGRKAASSSDQDFRKDRRQDFSDDRKRDRDDDNNDRDRRYSQRDKRNVEVKRPYKAFTGGFYVGANSTRYQGEKVDGKNPNGRLGYQIGAFARGGGRLYGQLGVEYFASSSNFFSPGDGTPLTEISQRIDTKWIQVPAYIGFKVAQSKRGISGIRLAVGAEYARRIGNSNTVEINDDVIKQGTFQALGNLGFDIGPLLIDFVYHHGLNNTIQGFNNSQRRAVGVNVGFKF